MGEAYKVNDEHIMTLHMPDHKVIFWSTNGWKMLWWDNIEKCIRTKFIKAYVATIECPVCHTRLVGNLKRHYSRCHPNDKIHRMPRKPPTKMPNLEDARVNNALDKMQEFAKSIDDDSVIDISISDYLKLPQTTQHRLAGLRGKCVDWANRPVDLDPYVLGLWLGDGVHHGYSYVCDGDNDHEIMSYLTTWGVANDARFKKTGRYISSLENYQKKGFAPLKKQSGSPVECVGGNH
jgi:hypothetical protein